MALMHYIGNSDALYEARRCRRAKPNCKQFDHQWYECKKSLEESKDIDEDYKAHLLCLINNADSEMQETRKREREVIDIDEEEDSDGEYDPQHELFLSKLKKFGKSYVLEDNSNGKPVFVKHEGVSTLEDDNEHESGRNKRDIKQIYGLSNQKRGLENDLAVRNKNACEMQAQLCKKDSTQSPRKLMNPIKRENVIKIKNEPSNKKPDHKDNLLAQNLHGSDVQTQSIFRPGNVIKGKNVFLKQKTGFGNNCFAKNKLDGDVQARSGMKGINRKSGNVEAAKCSMVYKENGDENNQENESDDELSLDVEILDSAEFFKAENLSPFVASKKIHESMGNEDDFQHLGNPCVYSEFRKQVLNVIGKPFDKEEYKSLRKMVDTRNSKDSNEGSCSTNKKKSYLDHHPDVKRKLKANRYNRHKCLIILRGFVFWLENLTKEGAFKPWLDQQCLAVEPKSQ